MKRILIIGAGVAGKDVLKEIKKYPELGIKVIGFIDDNPAIKNVHGVKVFGQRKDFKKVVINKKIEEIIIAIPSADGTQIAEYIRLCSEVKVQFRIVPRVKEIIEGKARINAVREVRIEDVLGRPVVKNDVSELKDFFTKKNVLITGAAGSIGSELSRQIAAYNPKKLILLDCWETGLFNLQMELKKNYPQQNMIFMLASIQDRKKIHWILKQHKPTYVFHAAAYKHVPLMEEHPEEAVKNNIFGTRCVVEESVINHVKRFVFVSTDKATKPINVMGATKLIAETITLISNGKTKFMTVRFGNVLDSSGSVIPIFRKQIKEGGPVTITDKNMLRYFMTIPEASQLILKAAQLGSGGELFLLDMGKPMRIVDLAQNIIRLHGLIPGKDIKIVYTGKRKGEKIAEDLFTSEEKIIATKKEKIFITKSYTIDQKKIPTFLKRIERIIENQEYEKIRKEFKKLIPSFPQEYEKIV